MGAYCGLAHRIEKNSLSFEVMKFPINGILIATAIACITMFSVPGRGRADDAICVVCINPDLTYRCKVLRDGGLMAGSRFQFFCIKEIAREGGHQSCSVRRLGTGVCEGLDKTLVFNGRMPESPVGRDAAGGPGVTPDPGGEVGAGEAAQNKAGEPRTLIELTDQTVKGSQKQLKKTGEVIGGAAKKSGEVISGAAKKTGQTIVGAVKKTGTTVGGAVKKSGEAIGSVAKKSGEVIGSAAKSTYDCVTSFFTNCF